MGNPRPVAPRRLRRCKFSFLSCNSSLTKELEEEREGRVELSNKVTHLETSHQELSTTNTTLQQMLSTTKEALEKEVGVVKALQLDQGTPAKASQSISSMGSAKTKSSIK